MNSFKTIPDYLDIIIRQIAKNSALVPQNGLKTGKLGIAILLYNYAQYKNDPEIAAYAGNLINTVTRKIRTVNFGKDFYIGLYDIAYGFHYLLKHDFVKIDDDIFDKIDSILFEKGNKALNLWELDDESEKGLYILNRLNFCRPSVENLWRRLMENCVNNFRDILMQRYTSYELFVFPCRVLIRFFHVCQILREHGQHCREINTLYEELIEFVKISYIEEKNLSDKFIFASLLAGIPEFEELISVNSVPQLTAFADIHNIYLTQLILDRSFSLPEITDKTILSIVENSQWFNELSNRINPYNAGLGNYFGGLTWMLLQWCIEEGEKQ